MTLRLRRVLVALLMLAFLGTGALPSYAKGSSGRVHVKGYTKKDGTHVGRHSRKEPKAKSPNVAKAPRAPKVAKPPKAKKSSSTTYRLPAVVGARDERGRMERSAAAKHAFEVQTGFPHGRPGYVVDHIRPLACGGSDAPSNMQWQTVNEARAKDAWERRGCR